MNNITLPEKWIGWEITGVIGKGSSGTVYRLERTASSNTVSKTATECTALKIIEIAASDEKDLMMINVFGQKDIVKARLAQKASEYSREVEMMEALRGSRHIVEILDHEIISEDDGLKWTIYIQMEYLDPLSEMMSRKILTLQEIRHLGSDICEALSALEKNHIIHRDIKPANIFWSEKDGFKLGDFGAACFYGDAGNDMPSTGTLNYMAPEVYKGLAFDHTADIYSLGMVMYRILNNNCGPFLSVPEKKAARPILHSAVSRRMSGEELPAPAADSPLSSAILKACRYVPAERYQSADQMRSAL